MILLRQFITVHKLHGPVVIDSFYGILSSMCYLSVSIVYTVDLLCLKLVSEKQVMWCIGLSLSFTTLNKFLVTILLQHLCITLRVCNENWLDCFFNVCNKIGQRKCHLTFTIRVSSPNFPVRNRSCSFFEKGIIHMWKRVFRRVILLNFMNKRAVTCLPSFPYILRYLLSNSHSRFGVFADSLINWMAPHLILEWFPFFA